MQAFVCMCSVCLSTIFLFFRLKCVCVRVCVYASGGGGGSETNRIDKINKQGS